MARAAWKGGKGVCQAISCHVNAMRCEEGYCHDCCEEDHQYNNGVLVSPPPHPLPAKAGVFEPLPAKLVEAADL